MLLIGFQSYDSNMYPHLQCVIDRMAVERDLTYFHFRERGYFTLHMSRQPSRLRKAVIAAAALATSAVDLLKLWRMRRRHEVVMAIDHYAYAIASAVFGDRKVILWSHDIIGPDSANYHHRFVQRFMNACGRALRRNRRVVVQSAPRLGLLRESLQLDECELDVFMMPVCLDGIGAAVRELSSAARPRLLQSGGIGAYRCSDRLLSHYQENFQRYRLYFHGFVFKEIHEQLARCKVQPMVSARAVSPKVLHQLSDFCDIGFVCYEDADDRNFFLIAHASGQLVEFLRIGMPVIVMGKNDLPQFVREHRVGVAIGDLSELNAAISAIAGDYRGYSENCLECFNQVFDSDRYVPRMSQWL